MIQTERNKKVIEMKMHSLFWYVGLLLIVFGGVFGRYVYTGNQLDLLAYQTFEESDEQAAWAEATPVPNSFLLAPGHYRLESANFLPAEERIEVHLNADQTVWVNIDVPRIDLRNLGDMRKRYSMAGRWSQENGVLTITGKEGAVGFLGGRFRIESVTESGFTISFGGRASNRLTGTRLAS